MDISINGGIGREGMIAIGGEASTAGAKAASGGRILFSEGNLTVTENEFLSACSGALGKDGTELLSELLNRRFDALKTVIDNLKPSEAEQKLRERKLQELEELKQLLENETVSYEQKRLAFINSIEPADVQLFWEQFHANSPQLV